MDTWQIIFLCIFDMEEGTDMMWQHRLQKRIVSSPGTLFQRSIVWTKYGSKHILMSNLYLTGGWGAGVVVLVCVCVCVCVGGGGGGGGDVTSYFTIPGLLHDTWTTTIGLSRSLVPPLQFYNAALDGADILGIFILSSIFQNEKFVMHRLTTHCAGTLFQDNFIYIKRILHTIYNDILSKSYYSNQNAFHVTNKYDGPLDIHGCVYNSSQPCSPMLVRQSSKPDYRTSP